MVRPPSTMDAILAAFLTVGKRIVENTSSCD